jgi:hypothetical protein
VRSIASDLVRNLVLEMKSSDLIEKDQEAAGEVDSKRKDFLLGLN